MIAESLTQYLAPTAVRDLFVQCDAISGAGSRVAFTYVRTGTDGRPNVGRWTGFTLWLPKASGEPWLWSIRPEELPRFLEETGWRAAPDLIEAAGRHGVEYLAVASR